MILKEITLKEVLEADKVGIDTPYAKERYYTECAMDSVQDHITFFVEDENLELFVINNFRYELFANQPV